MINLNSLTEKEVFARTIYGEARGESLEGKVAVANVVMNRVNTDLHNDNKPDWWGEGVRGVCLKPWQFSCWNKNDPNRSLLLSNLKDTVYEQCLLVADLAMIGLLKDNTKGATHYFDLRMPEIMKPDWSKEKEPVCQIGHHVFYDV